MIRALLAFVGFLLALCVLEVALRIIPYQGSRERTKLSSRFQPYYSSPMPTLEEFPGAEGATAREGLIVVHGRSISLQKRSGTRRVLFIGDSGTYGSGVAFEKSFPFIFEEACNRKTSGGPVEVINAGRRGLSTVGEVQLLKDELLRLKPDAVILGLFMANDLNFNVAHTNVEKLSPVETGFLKSFYLLRRYSALGHFVYLRLLALSNRHRLIERLGLRDARWIPVEYRLIEPSGLSMVNYLHGEIASYRVPFSPLMQKSFLVLEDQLRELQALSAQHKFSLAIVILPTSSSVAGKLSMLTYPDALSELRREGIEIHESELDVMAPTREVLRICEKLHIVCVDPTKELAISLGFDAFLQGDDHLSVRGHQSVGELLAASSGDIQ